MLAFHFRQDCPFLHHDTGITVHCQKLEKSFTIFLFSIECNAKQHSDVTLTFPRLPKLGFFDE